MTPRENGASPGQSHGMLPSASDGHDLMPGNWKVRNLGTRAVSFATALEMRGWQKSHLRLNHERTALRLALYCALCHVAHSQLD